MEGWIKLHRKLQDWEWYHNSQMVHLFIHLLLSSNRRKKKWRGIETERGQTITGLKSLNKETGISVQSIRTCIKRLKSTGEITIKSTNKHSIITICNYDDYQLQIDESNRLTNKQPNKQSTTSQQATNNKQEYKERKEYREEKNIILLSQVDESTLDQREKEYFQIAISFWKLIKTNLSELNLSISTIENAEYKKWINPIRLLIEKDKKTIDEIREVFYFLKTDDFWKEQIRSTSKFRKKDKDGMSYFELLLIKSRNGNRRKNAKESRKSGVSEDYEQSIFERLLNPGNQQEIQEY
jgi:uncharacterized protein (UPF0335 family)